jgi:polysaccharide pyruvyl transferase WcaK-like protein
MYHYNCLLVGNYGNFNIGDELLLKGAVQEIIHQFGSDCKFYVPTRNTEFIETYHKEQAELLVPVKVNSISSLLKAFTISDMIVIGGGGIWSGYTGLFAHLIPFVGVLGKIARKQLHFKSIGLYSTASKFDRWFVNLSISIADSCTVRDEESFEQLWRSNRKKTKQVDDLSISYLKNCDENIRVPEHDAIEALRRQGKMLVGVSIKPTYDHEINLKVIKEFSNAFSLLNSKYGPDLQFLLFPFAKTDSNIENDAAFIQDLIRTLPQKDNITVVSHTNPVAWYNTLRKFVDIFIGMRFHSIIFAYESNKPLLCIAYENKITQFLKNKVNNTTIVETVPAEVTSAAICKFIEENLPEKKIYP